MRRISAFSMSRECSEWMAVEEGSDDSVHSISQVLSFLRGAYRDRDYNKAEKLLMLREERIKNESVKEVKAMMVEMEKKIEVEKKLRNEVEKALDVKVEMEERLMKECEDLKEENLRLADVDKDVKKRVKELELKAKEEVGLRKKAEEELEVWMNKCNEMESKILSLTKAVDLLRSLEAGAQGSEMEVEDDVQATVRSPHNQFTEGANSGNPVSAAKHGLENYIDISSSSDDIPSNDNSDIAAVKLKFESDHGSPEVSSEQRKRQHMSSINEDKTESISQPSNALPSRVSVTPPPGFGIMKPVNSGQAEGTSLSLKVSLDDEQYIKSLLEKLKRHWDDISSDSSSDI